jgi:hypothetical protein
LRSLNPDTTRGFKVGDFVVFNDEAKDPDNSGRRSFECAQIVGPGNEGDVVPSGNFQFQRAYPGVPAGQATFGTLRCAHLKGVRFYKLDFKIFTFSVKKGFFRTPGLPARVEAKLPSACVVAALVGVANHFGFGPFTVFPLSHHSEPFMPGDRTCNGGAYTFQAPGPLSVQENVVIPLKVQDAASIRCICAYLQQGTSDGQSAFLVKISRDGGATWEPLDYMGIAQAQPDAYKNTYDFLVNNEGYGLPASRRLPYADDGLTLAQAVTANPSPQTILTASYGANGLGLAAGQFLFLDPGGANEEYCEGHHRRPRARRPGETQNTPLTPNCNCRGAAAELTIPKSAFPRTCPGSPKLAWLRRLNASARSCSLSLSRIGKSRRIDAFTELLPAARTMLTPWLPNRLAAGWTKAPVSNQRTSDRFEDGRFGSRSTSARSGPAEKDCVVFVAVRTVIGGAVCQIRTDDTDQPPSIAPAIPRLPKRRPGPPGSRGS